MFKGGHTAIINMVAKEGVLMAAAITSDSMFLMVSAAISFYWLKPNFGKRPLGVALLNEL